MSSTPPPDPEDPDHARWTRPAREAARPRAQGAAPPGKVPIQPSDAWLGAYRDEPAPSPHYRKPKPTVPAGEGAPAPKVTRVPEGASGKPPRAKPGEGVPRWIDGGKR